MPPVEVRMRGAPPLRSPGSLLLLALLLLAGSARQASAAWTLTSVQARRDFGLSSSRFDPGGRPAVAFGAGSLYLAVSNGVTWDVEMVVPGCGGERGPSLAYGPTGEPMISYHDQAGVVRLARSNGGVWTIETVDEKAIADGGTSLALDALGNPAVAYYIPNQGQLRFAAFDGRAWTATTVDGATSSVGAHASLAFDRNGLPAIGYHDLGNGRLKLARFDGAAWKLEVVDGPGTGRWASLAFDPLGNPAVAYGESNGTGNVKYAAWDGTAWAFEHVAINSGTSAGISLGFDGGGRAAVAYHDGNGGGHVYYAARIAPGTWSVVDVDPQFRSGLLPSLAFDAAGSPGISYHASVNGALNFARWTGSGFAPEHVVSGDPHGGSIAFDRAGNPAVSYADSHLGGLKLGRFDGTVWTVETVDPGAWAGTGSSLRFDGAGFPLIAYDDRLGGHLKLARFDGTGWTLETVDGSSSVPTAPMSPSLALDPDGYPAISYTWLASSLKLARWDGSSWTTEVVVPNVPLPAYDARTLAFDAGGQPAIVYEQGPGPSRGIRFTRWDGARWVDELVDPVGVGTPSLAFDGGGEPVVLYTVRPLDPDVMLARRAGASWQPELVGPGWAGAVAIDPTGNPAVAYAGGFAWWALRVARWDGVAWSSEGIVQASAAGTIAIDPAGRLAVVYYGVGPCGAPQVALSTIDLALHRGVVASLAPGWQAAALPLTALNDDPTPPFPAAVKPPGIAPDASPPAAPLVLYRVLYPGNADAGNLLRAAKDWSRTGVWLAF